MSWMCANTRGHPLGRGSVLEEEMMRWAVAGKGVTAPYLTAAVHTWKHGEQDNVLALRALVYA